MYLSRTFRTCHVQFYCKTRNFTNDIKHGLFQVFSIKSTNNEFYVNTKCDTNVKHENTLMSEAKYIRYVAKMQIIVCKLKKKETLLLIQKQCKYGIVQ